MWYNPNTLHFINEYPNYLHLYFSASGTSAVAIDNKIEQAMVSSNWIKPLIVLSQIHINTTVNS